MAQQIINVGAAPNDGQGDPIRNAYIKCNDNFSQLYSRAQLSPPATLVGSIGDEAGMYAYDATYFYYCFADYDGSSIIWAQVTQIANVSISSISSGTSQVAVADVNGNVAVTIGGVSNVAVINNSGMQVVGNMSATGNITASFFLGNGAFLSGLPETYTNANVESLLPVYSGNIAANNLVLTTSLNAASASVSGNVSAGNINTPGQISATGNITTTGFFVGNFTGNVTANLINIPGPAGAIVYNDGTGNGTATSGLVYDASGPNVLNILGSISATANAVLGNVSTAGFITATGNITGGNVSATNLTGTLLTASQTNVTALGTLVSLSVSGNIQGGNVRTAGLISATGNIEGANLRVNANADIGGNVVASNFSGSSITVVGNMVSGNASTGNVNAGNVIASGNITGNYIFGNGSQLTGIDTTSIQNGNSNVRVALNGNVTVGISGTNSIVTVANNGLFVAGISSATGNVSGENFFVAGFVSASGNITGANLTVAQNAVITGNLTVNGTTTTVNSNTVTINDKFINVANNAATSSAANGGGIGVGPVGSEYAKLEYDQLSNTWNTNIGLAVTGIVSATGNITGTNITGTSLTVNAGNVTLGNIVNSNANGTGNIGSSVRYFNTVFAKATSAQYADLAELYVPDQHYDAGTVVVFGGQAEVTVSDIFADTRVAGVISTNPAYIMNATESQGQPVALRGKVPVNVIGPVTKGDLLVTAPHNPGRAVSIGNSLEYASAVFAKALETNSGDGEKTIIAVIV